MYKVMQVTKNQSKIDGEYDIIYKLINEGRTTRTYEILKKPDNITLDELVDQIDSGNFGYHCLGNRIEIYID